MLWRYFLKIHFSFACINNSFIIFLYPTVVFQLSTIAACPLWRIARLFSITLLNFSVLIGATNAYCRYSTVQQLVSLHFNYFISLIYLITFTGTPLYNLPSALTIKGSFFSKPVSTSTLSPNVLPNLTQRNNAVLLLPTVYNPVN